MLARLISKAVAPISSGSRFDASVRPKVFPHAISRAHTSNPADMNKRLHRFATLLCLSMLMLTLGAASCLHAEQPSKPPRCSHCPQSSPLPHSLPSCCSAQQTPLPATIPPVASKQTNLSPTTLPELPKLASSLVRYPSFRITDPPISPPLRALRI